ncbi:Bicupin, oxalate decarboxylase/oxidase [Laetiporus sulphureus 93-53]|uniref:Bicupin, oxalate decarboxylase/oxidase n=1 Tax=Laetiporus sulphureus 93-53 TaxID=1314785 RepID=A0A165EG99_9APHY|nr:Bicupin, oxalate decarboxylase/oxidase [Laetiporus sulphureus 93-53]KZT06997.1 Bicupin, oxalate decarboxylase/oxidase [Laetiporus sulphureus 93-53]
MVEPIRDGKGSNIVGPRNPDRERQNPDMMRPPQTDWGTVLNMKWSFADSHMRLEEGGWAREVTIRELPMSRELASTNMRLEEGAVRDLHWHNDSEWAYILEGRVRITGIDYGGHYFEEDVEHGDLWFFPRGVPHSLQGLEGGCEFLLIFDDGEASEYKAFQLTDWFAHTPRDVLRKNFKVSEETLQHLPPREKFIFRSILSKKSTAEETQPGSTPTARRMTHKMLAQTPIKTPGGEVRVTDSSIWPITTIAAAHVLINPGALREMHWHPYADEWSYFIRGKAKVTIFTVQATRTFNFVPGDVMIVPSNCPHYIENIGDEPIEMIEVFRSPKFEEFSANQYLAVTPADLVKGSLNVGDDFIKALDKGHTPIRDASMP